MILYIGIDPGVNTGIASSLNGELQMVKSLPIHRAMMEVSNLSDSNTIKVIVEDARKRKWFGNNSNAKMQGAGSVKRDCSIWEEFLKDIDVEFEMVSPGKGLTKLDSDNFKQLTGWSKATNNHARDAAMIVFGR